MDVVKLFLAIVILTHSGPVMATDIPSSVLKKHGGGSDPIETKILCDGKVYMLDYGAEVDGVLLYINSITNELIACCGGCCMNCFGKNNKDPMCMGTTCNEYCSSDGSDPNICDAVK